MQKIQIIENKNELIIIIPKSPNWSIVIFTGLWLSAFLIMAIVILYGLITDLEKPAGEILSFFSLFLIFSLFVLKAFLWNLRGREKITLNIKELKIEHLGTILSWPSIFDINFIGRFEIADKVKIPIIIKIYGLAGGQIQFDYWEQIRYFGQSLEKEKAEEVKNLLNNTLKNYSN